MELDAAKVRQAVFQGLGPLEQKLAGLGLVDVSEAWGAFTQGPTKKLLSGDLTVDDWKKSLGAFCQRLSQAKVPAPALQAIVADANGAAILVEESFNPPSKVRWILVGGVAVTALAWWWLKREEKQNRRLLVATPESIVGTPRRLRPPREEPEEAEFEEI